MLYNNERGCFVAPNSPNHRWYVGGNEVPPGDEIRIPLLVMEGREIANQGALLSLKGVEGLGDGMYEVWRSPITSSDGDDDYEPGIGSAPSTAATPRLVVVRLERHTAIEGGDDNDG